MDSIQIIVLALIQGLTEFLPISSSGHLVLAGPLFGWEDQGLAFDVAVHVGTLMAVIAYFRQDLITLAARGWRPGDEQQQIIYLALATLPVVVVGVLLGDWIESWSRSVVVIASTTLVFGLLLGFADKRVTATTQITLTVALVVGAAQILALIPGTSRSGITITAALLMGLSRTDASRFSFLLAIPVIAGAGLLKSIDLMALESSDWQPLIWGALISGISAYLCIGWFMRFVERIGLMPFVYYRIALAGVLFASLVL